MTNSLFTKFIENDNANIIKKLKKLLFYYNRSIKMIKLKYFYKYYYKVLKIKSFHKKKTIFESKNSFNNKINENNLGNKTFYSPIRIILHMNYLNNNKSLHKQKRIKIFDDSKYDNKYELNKTKSMKNTIKYNYMLNNDYFNNTLENKIFRNTFAKKINDNINDIIFNYINDIKKYKINTKQKRKTKSNIFSGNKTFTNKIISKDLSNKRNNWFDINNYEIIKFDNKNSNDKNEKNKNEKGNQTININNYYILNSSLINDKLQKERINELYKEEYKSNFLKNPIIKIKSPKKDIKSKIIKIKKNIRDDIFNHINNNLNNQKNTTKNIIHKSIEKTFPKSSKNKIRSMNINNRIKANKKDFFLMERINNRIKIKNNPLLNISSKKLNRTVMNKKNIIKSLNTRNSLDIYNNSLLTTYYKDINNGKGTYESGFNTLSKNTSFRNILTCYKSKYTIPCSNKKQLIDFKSTNGTLNINKNYTSSKKDSKILATKNNSYINMINNKKEQINNHNLILQNLSFSNCSEKKNLSENKAKNLNQNNKKVYYDKDEIINQKLDNIFIKNEIDNNFKNKYNIDNNKLKGKEKITETSSETLSDSKIYEMAKLYIKNEEENLDKQILEQILKNKKIKK